MFDYVCIYSCKGAIGKLLGDYQHGLESTNKNLWNCLKHSHEQPNIPSTICQSYGISNASNVNSIKFTIITLAQFLHWSSLLKLTSKVMMWGSTKIRMCFCCPFLCEKHGCGQTMDKRWNDLELPWNGLELSWNNLELSWTLPPQKKSPKQCVESVSHIYQCTFWDGLWTTCQSWKQRLIT